MTSTLTVEEAFSEIVLARKLELLPKESFYSWLIMSPVIENRQNDIKIVAGKITSTEPRSTIVQMREPITIYIRKEKVTRVKRKSSQIIMVVRTVKVGHEEMPCTLTFYSE